MSDPGGTVTLEMLGRMMHEAQVERREIRRELDTMRPLLMSLVEQARRAERRNAEIKDDLELMIRAELMGALGNFRNRTERDLDDIRDRVSTLETK